METDSLQLWKRFIALLWHMDALAQDKWFGGKYETISAHLGRIQVRYGNPIPWRRPIQAALSRILDWVDPHHCYKAYIYEKRQSGLL